MPASVADTDVADTGADRCARLRLLCGLATLAMAGACGGGGGGGTDAAAASPAPVAGAPAAGGTTTAAAGATASAPAAWGTAKTSARLFISGHSLTDDPLGDDIVLIANSIGGSNAAKYNEQIVIGSPIKDRTDRDAGWAGYSRGKNRGGSSGMNVIDELRNPSTLGGDRYDTLVIAENHNLLEMLQFQNTVRNLRHYHERLLAGNAQGRTYFYETWKDVYDKGNPRAWIEHERASSQAWQCIAQRVNTSLAAENRADRITPLPVGAALADLVERATQGNVPGITGANATETINRLFSDDVHLTATGMYYAALVTYAAVYQRSPEGASAPSGVSSQAATSLQTRAWNYVSNFYANYSAPNLDSCRTQVAQNYCTTYWNYRSNVASIANCAAYFVAAAVANPLHYSAGSDASYWYPAP